jgi:hypothetical protein
LVSATTGIAPTTPGPLTFTATTRTSINLQWSLLAGADTGGSDAYPLTITAYLLHVSSDTTLPEAIEIDGSISAYLVENLKANIEYTFRLQAVNSIGLRS